MFVVIYEECDDWIVFEKVIYFFGVVILIVLMWIIMLVIGVVVG